VAKKLDERRSFGALCACTASNMFEVLPQVLKGDLPAVRRTRIQTVVRSTLKETKLPPALNDILVAHPIPAAVSRFRLGFITDAGEEAFNFNVWSSGLWISTATGSSAAMSAAGGTIMDPLSSELQYMVREHLLEAGGEHLKEAGHGMVKPGHTLHMRWNSQHGSIYVDGSHVKHNLELGDTVSFSAEAPPLWLVSKLDGSAAASPSGGGGSSSSSSSAGGEGGGGGAAAS
jgi:NAD+ kinase